MEVDAAMEASGAEGADSLLGRVEAGDPAVQCQWAQGPGPQVTLKVRIDSSRAAVGLKSEVRVYLRQPSELTVTIPVTWAGK